MTRPIEALKLPGAAPAAIASARPTFRDVDPLSLHVDEKYQRQLSTRSLNLIRRIVTEWRWEAFKPPVCVETGGELHIIDGQHTAIAAATHGGIATIPVMIVEAEDTEARADAFVRHNRDRIAVKGLELFFAQLAGGDEEAATVVQVCERANVRLLRYVPPSARLKAGETLAVGTLLKLVDRRHAMGARRVLDIAAKSRAAPISADLLKAIELLVFSDEYKGEIADEDIASVILGAHDLEPAAKRWSIEHKVPTWRGLASTIFMRRKRRRG